MQRLDFVSNSSSCSFFVYLPNENSVNQFKKVFNVIKKCASIEKWDTFPFPEIRSEIKNSKDINVKDFYCVYFGEDHTEENIISCEDTSSLVAEFTDIHMYKDPDAHYTFGKKLPKSMEVLHDKI